MQIEIVLHLWAHADKNLQMVLIIPKLNMTVKAKYVFSIILWATSYGNMIIIQVLSLILQITIAYFPWFILICLIKMKWLQETQTVNFRYKLNAGTTDAFSVHTINTVIVIV